MSYKEKNLTKLMKDLNINNNILSAEEKQLLLKGGYTISDSSDNSINNVIDFNLVL